MSKIYVGIDNGVSGSIGIIYPDAPAAFYATPVKRCLNYTKTKKWINRIDINVLREILRGQKAAAARSNSEILLGLERPMVNPGRFAATVSAIRALEATLILLEELEIPYLYLDSKEWQKVVLPKGLEGPELKTASKEIATRLYPHLTKLFKKDGDSIMMANYLQVTDKKKEL